VFKLLGNLGWIEMLRPMRGFENFTYEFLSFIAFTKDRFDSTTYELQLNVPLCLIILPNPSRTNTEMEDNLLYVGDDPQVHEEHPLGVEEGANLHQDEEHHDYEVGGHYNDERWAWMQTEV